jgi:hypothetical protein
MESVTVLPATFNVDGSLVAVCTHCGASTAFASGVALRSTSGSLANLTCGTCGGASSHPIAGGAEPRRVQELFVRAARSAGCPCGSPIPSGRPYALVAAHIRLHADQLDGPGRYQAGNTFT